MTHLRDVSQIKNHALELVGPMKDIILLLKKHGVEMNQDFLVLLENCKTDLIDVSDRLWVLNVQRRYVYGVGKNQKNISK